MKRVFIISFCMIILSLSLYSQRKQTKDSVFFEKYGRLLHSAVYKNILSDLVFKYFECIDQQNVNYFYSSFDDNYFPVIDTGCHYKLDFERVNDIIISIQNNILIKYHFKYAINYYHKKFSFFEKDTSFLYLSTELAIDDNRDCFKNLLKDKIGLISIDTISKQIIYYCGTRFSDKFENYYFDNDSSQIGFLNFIKIKYYNYIPQIEYIDYDRQLCHFYSKVTEKRYYCMVSKRVDYNKKEELYHKWIVDFGELEE